MNLRNENVSKYCIFMSYMNLRDAHVSMYWYFYALHETTKYMCLSICIFIPYMNLGNAHVAKYYLDAKIEQLENNN